MAIATFNDGKDWQLFLVDIHKIPRESWRCTFLEITPPSYETRPWLTAPRLFALPSQQVKEIFNADDQNP